MNQIMKDRINSIDILRGLTIILMIQYHIYEFWTNQNYNLFGVIICFFGSLAAPFFLIISGIGFYLLINKRIKENFSKIKILNGVLKRSFFIFIISTLFQIFFGFLFGMQISFIIYWSVFQVIAFSMIFFFIIPFLKRNLRVYLYLISFFIIFLINYVIIFYDIKFLSILVDGTFPFIPWANFFIFGLFIGDLLTYSLQDRINRKILIFISIGIINLLLWILWVNIIPYFLDVSFFLMVFGIFFILFSVCYFYFDVKFLASFFQKTLIRWGKLSFSIYYIQFAIIAGGIIIFPLMINDFHLNGFSIFQYVIILLIIFLALEIFIKLWKRFDYFLGIEWLMNKFIKKSLFYK